ncbi:MAG: efflux RND transporter permease subunit [Candidatus Tectomicrobia bacterium]|uniref:Efflux RND transporter permease subunit n=1 Tax=Tectimicrobiota bacterium TaxID=2528274 RepID=A0A932I1A0_UNCTE|nr:efflux RND transporter permease subunit [Candidatus Tectomicrobia bacterium]
MNLSELFIRRPVTTTLVMVGMLMFGAAAYRLLPVSDLPNVDFPTVLVSASIPGASPETMASAVATPLERQFSTISGLSSMNSVSTLGYTQITLQFDLSRNINDVPPDIQAAITQASRLLPPNMPSPPTYQKVNPADTPILYIALTSRTMPLWQLNEYAQTIMADRISMIEGVAQVNVFGTQKYAVRVQLDPDAMASRGIGINEVETAIQNANVNLPVGTLSGPHRTFTIQSAGQLLSAAPYGSIVVAYRNGAPVRLRDIGRAVDSSEDDKQAAWFVNKNGSQRGMILAIQRQPGANTVAVADAVKETLPKLRTYLPPSVELHTLYDRSVTIRESVEDVQFTLLLSFALVVMVVFLFLRNLSATVIPSLALPMSIVGTFAVMYPLGFSIDNLSLMALTLSIGFVVDDAIVMLENIVRHMEMGERPLEAALKGSREIGFTILSMTISLAAVFIPVLFMGGIVGRLFREFSVVIVAAILISGVVSLTLTPMLCSRFLRPPSEERHGRFYNASERVFEGMFSLYKGSLGWVLRHRFSTLMVNLIVLVLTGFLFVKVSKGFIPDEDTSQIFVVTEAPQGTSFQALGERQQELARIAQRDPNIAQFFSGVGGPASASMGGQNFGRMFYRLVPPSERQLDVNGVIQVLRVKLSGVPGINVFMQNPPAIRIGGRLSKSLYQFTLQSPDLKELYSAAPLLENKLRALPELQDVTSDLQIKNPQLRVSLDRDKAASLGISAQQVEAALANAYGPRWISTIYAPNNQYRVLLELEPRFQADPAVLSKLYIQSQQRQLVPLATVASFTEDMGPQAIAHYGQLPAVTLSFNLRPGVSLGDAVSKVQAVARETLPASMTTSFQGTAQAFQSSFQGMGLLLIVAILFIYIVLGILYESFIHPITILSGLPSAGLGALLTLLIFGNDLNIYSFIGLIMLVGIVKKNAIMQIDFALEAERNEGKSPVDAIYEGCLIRFRPIMMTTMAALLGALPIALGIGAGAGARRPLGLAVVGGLLISQLITLYLTPVVYVYLDLLQKKMGGLGRFRRRRLEIHAGAGRD